MSSANFADNSAGQPFYREIKNNTGKYERTCDRNESSQEADPADKVSAKTLPRICLHLERLDHRSPPWVSYSLAWCSDDAKVPRIITINCGHSCLDAFFFIYLLTHLFSPLTTLVDCTSSSLASLRSTLRLTGLRHGYHVWRTGHVAGSPANGDKVLAFLLAKIRNIVNIWLLLLVAQLFHWVSRW